MTIVRTSKIFKKNKMTDREKMYLLERNYNLIIITVLLIFGIIAGAILITKTSDVLKDTVSELYSHITENNKEQSFFYLFINTFLSSAIYMLIFFIMGLNAIGVPFIYFISCLKGMSCGIISGFLYMNYGMAGIKFSIIIIFPYAVISCILTTFMGSTSLKMSKTLFTDLVGKFVINDNNITFKKYCIHFIIYTAVFIFASVVDATVKTQFADVALQIGTV